MRAAMKKADFKSVRGKFKYGNNHFPVQNFYLRDVVEPGNDLVKTVNTVFKDHQDKCQGMPDEVIRALSTRAAEAPAYAGFLLGYGRFRVPDTARATGNCTP